MARRLGFAALVIMVLTRALWANTVLTSENMFLPVRADKRGDVFALRKPQHIKEPCKLMKLVKLGVLPRDWSILLFENFEDGALPFGWSVVDGNGDENSWKVYATSDWYSDAMPPQAGNYIVGYDDDAVGGAAPGEEQLITPAVYVGGVDTFYVIYGVGFNSYNNYDTLFVRMRYYDAAGWSEWYDIAYYGDDYIGCDTLGYVFLLPCDSLQIQFAWRDMQTDHWDWYVAVDNVQFIVNTTIPSSTDLALIDIESPSDLVTVGSCIYPTVKVANVGNSNVTGEIYVLFHVLDYLSYMPVYADTEVIKDGLNAGDTVEVMFTQWDANKPGYYYAASYVLYRDDDTLNNSLIMTVTLTSGVTGKVCGPFDKGTWLADMAFNPNTRTFYCVVVGEDNGILEWDPNTCRRVSYITPDWGTSQRGIAYNPHEDVLYVGGWNEGVVYSVDPHTGNILNSFPIPEALANFGGLAYDDACKLLWLIAHIESAVDVLAAFDPHTGELLYGPVQVDWRYPSAFGCAGLEWHRPGYLIALNQSTQTIVILDRKGQVRGLTPIYGLVGYGWGIGADWDGNTIWVTDADDTSSTYNCFVEFNLPSFEPFDWECPCPPPFMRLIAEYNFNNSDCGFTAYAPNPSLANDWEWGSYDGFQPNWGCDTEVVNYWGTRIGNNYSNHSGSRLLSPPIIVHEGYWLEVCHFYDIESDYDGANVKVTTDGENFEILHPFNGYPDDSIYSSNPFIPYEPGFTDESDGWMKSYFNLEEYEGETVRIAFDFGSDASISRCGWYINWIKIWSTVPAEIKEEQGTLRDFAEFDVIPNPTSGNVAVIFSLPRNADIELKIYDAAGRLVKSLVKDRLNAGLHRISWDGLDEELKAVPSGIYFLRLRAGTAAETRKLLLVR